MLGMKSTYHLKPKPQTPKPLQNPNPQTFLVQGERLQLRVRDLGLARRSFEYLEGLGFWAPTPILRPKVQVFRILRVFGVFGVSRVSGHSVHVSVLKVIRPAVFQDIPHTPCLGFRV